MYGASYGMMQQIVISNHLADHRARRQPWPRDVVFRDVGVRILADGQPDRRAAGFLDGGAEPVDPGRSTLPAGVSMVFRKASRHTSGDPAGIHRIGYFAGPGD